MSYNSVLNVKAVVAALNQEKALVGAFSVITNLRMELFEALVHRHDATTWPGHTLTIITTCYYHPPPIHPVRICHNNKVTPVSIGSLTRLKTKEGRFYGKKYVTMTSAKELAVNKSLIYTQCAGTRVCLPRLVTL